MKPRPGTENTLVWDVITQITIPSGTKIRDELGSHNERTDWLTPLASPITAYDANGERRSTDSSKDQDEWITSAKWDHSFYGRIMRAVVETWTEQTVKTPMHNSLEVKTKTAIYCKPCTTVNEHPNAFLEDAKYVSRMHNAIYVWRHIKTLGKYYYSNYSPHLDASHLVRPSA